MQSHPRILFLSIRYSAAILLALFLLSRSAIAQETPKLRVIVADSRNVSSSRAIHLTTDVMNALRDALAASEKYQAVDAKDVLDTGHKLKMDIAHPDYIGLTRSDLFRIAKELHAHAILFSEYFISLPAEKRSAYAGLAVNLTDVTSGEVINGGVESIIVNNTDQAVEQLTMDMVDQMEKRALSTVTVLMHKTVLEHKVDTIRLNKRSRDGLHKGDDMVIVRETEGQKTLIGRIRLSKVHTHKADSTVLKVYSDTIRPGDTAIIVYPPFVVAPNASIADRRADGQSFCISDILSE